jgi:hypothetical protein
MRLRLVVLLVAAFGILSSACGPGDSSTETTGANQPADNGGVADGSGGGDGSDDGNGRGTDGPGPGNDGLPDSVPEDFPIAIPPGWSIDINAEIGLSASAAFLLYPSGDFDAIVDFYDEWTTSQPDEYARTEAGDQVIYTRMETPTYLISVTRNHEERDQTWTLLQASGSAE